MLLGRLTEAEDVAAAVAFLLSDEASAITGVLLDVDAGNHVDTGSWSPFSPDAVGTPGGAADASGAGSPDPEAGNRCSAPEPVTNLRRVVKITNCKPS